MPLPEVMAMKDEFDGRPAPLEGCDCTVCRWIRENAALQRPRPIRPSDPEWADLVRNARTVVR
jgi:hypothetical protein